ncbi:hypothetical protein I7I53_01442 [Histoplasma capsulatum var. duboisii H88]|uniref:Uncharacterized protein n=1 Tax=Ajellomyces capsulatus (strain H88) TaxID=544711 RepID=A0A8A1LJ69_AJEC8|nr:hypothetical protein I7I53_01442 [Histoplasma capsulatum var. duboisii H88]
MSMGQGGNLANLNQPLLQKKKKKERKKRKEKEIYDILLFNLPPDNLILIVFNAITRHDLLALNKGTAVEDTITTFTEQPKVLIESFNGR